MMLDPRLVTGRILFDLVGVNTQGENVQLSPLSKARLVGYSGMLDLSA